MTLSPSMMAFEGPDPKTFLSWEDAFQYPIPAVRGMEKQLRRDIDSNREKLRTLVGASYRDLLGTAEMITEMDGRMHDVEALMSDIGQRCNARLIERKGANLQAWSREVGAKNSAHFAFTSHLAVLRSCPEVISSLLKTGGSVLLAAKVLVLSRLLYTKLAKLSNPPPLIETIRSRLATLRRRLLGKIDRRFQSLKVEKEALVEAMCAFSLAKSLGPGDVVRHFDHLRLEALSGYVSEATGTPEDLLGALQLYVKTLWDTQTLLPVQLSQALGKLKAVSIFKSLESHGLIELNLDIYKRWIGEDIKCFTPYIRHDDLSQAESEEKLRQWARKALKTFLDGLQRRIQNVQDPVELMQLRKQVLELWLGHHQPSLGIDSAEVLDGLRTVFIERGKVLIHVRGAALKEVGATVDGTIQLWQEGVTDALPSLWSSSMISMGTSDGGKAFRQRLMDLATGKNEPLQNVIVQYTSWLQSIQAIEAIIKQLKSAKWVNDIDVDNEDDLLDNKGMLLNEDDPRTLEVELGKTLVDAFAELENALSSVASKMSKKQRGQQAVFLLRVWREIRQCLPQSFREENLGCKSILHLLNEVAKATFDSPLDNCSSRIAKAARIIHLPARQLWEGDPELPVLPSPWSYRLLLETVQSMADYGTDIWSPEAVNMIKRVMIEHLSKLLGNNYEVTLQVNGQVDGDVNKAEVSADQAERSSEGSENDDISDPSPTDTKSNGALANGDNLDSEAGQDYKIQKLLDTFYLVNATAVKGLDDDDNGLVRCQRSIIQDVALEPRAVERIRKSAAEYWTRTSLLFGLLA
ncbi:MAG: hypothetical protein Q9217_001620 [Psora testacea]